MTPEISAPYHVKGSGKMLQASEHRSGTAAPAALTVTLSGKDASGKAVFVTLALPDSAAGWYRGTRFAHVPMIVSASWNGHTFWGEWNPSRGDPFGHDNNAIGTAEEFDINGPASFADTAPGAAFLKIGVGLLRKPEGKSPSDRTYNFWNPYTVVRAARQSPVRRGAGFVETEQEVLSDDRRLGYRYRYRVALLPGKAALRITRTLTNRGSQSLATEWYCHNFSRIDGDSVGPDYQLRLAYAPVVSSEHAASATAAGLRVSDRTLSFAVPLLPGKTAYAALLAPNTAKKLSGDFSVVNLRTRATLRAAQIGTTPSRVALYAAHGAVCPEPFVSLTLAPGASRTWGTVYTLGEEQ